MIDAERERVLVELAKRGVKSVCPECDADQVLVDEASLEHELDPNAKLQMTPDKSAWAIFVHRSMLNVFVVICTHCGLVRSFSKGVLG